MTAQIELAARHWSACATSSKTFGAIDALENVSLDICAAATSLDWSATTAPASRRW